MANKQLSEFEKGLIVAYNNCERSLHDIAKKLNHSLWSWLITCWKHDQILSKQKLMLMDTPTKY